MQIQLQTNTAIKTKIIEAQILSPQRSKLAMITMHIIAPIK